MKGYIEKLDINLDDKSARVVIFFPKLSKKNYDLLRSILLPTVLVSIFFRKLK